MEKEIIYCCDDLKKATDQELLIDTGCGIVINTVFIMYCPFCGTSICWRFKNRRTGEHLD